MIYLVDTSSLKAYAQYYLPFANKNLKQCVSAFIANGEWLILDKVYYEFRNIGQGSFFSLLEQEYSAEKLPYRKAGDPLFSGITKFLKRLDGEFAVSSLQKTLRPEQFEQEKANWLQDADAQLILYGLSQIEKGSAVTIITEETPFQNDGKVIRKIPYICERTKIHSIDLVTFFKQKDLLSINTP